MAKIIKIVLLIVLAAGAWAVFRGESTETPHPAGRRVVVDSAGRSVAIPVRPQRVVALNASNVDLFYAAGGSLVGRPSTMTLPPAVREKVAGLPAVGETPSPSVEKIIALKPDLVLGADVPFHHVLLPALEKAGIPVILQSLPNYRQIGETIRLFGEITGNKQEAEEAAARIESQVRRVKERCAGRPQPLALAIWGSPESFNMALPGSFIGDLFQLLGAANAAEGRMPVAGDSGYAPLSLEYIAKVNPDVILLITHASAEKVSEKFRNELQQHPAWQGMKAVREGRVYKLPYHLFAVNPGTQVALAVEHLAGLLYPEVKSP